MKVRRNIAVVLLIVVLVWLLGLGGWPFIAWSPLNCRYEEIDINSGRIRHRRIVAGVCVSQRVEESPLSRQLPSNSAETTPDWKRVNTFSPLVGYSPHHGFHGSIAQVRLLEMIWRMPTLTTDA